MMTLRRSVLAGLAASMAAALAIAAQPASAEPVKSGYQLPPAPITAMIDAAPTPSVSLSHKGAALAIFGRENLPSVAKLAEPIYRLGGWRVSARTNGPAEIRSNWLTSLSLQDVASGKVRTVQLPDGLRFVAPRWSPDDRWLAFVAEAPGGLELWVADATTGQVRRVSTAAVNGAFGVSYRWTPDSKALVFPRVPEGRGAAPAQPSEPAGPTVQENAGRPAPVRTYQDLLANAHDEALFEHVFTSQLARADLASGAVQAVGQPAAISSFDLSPDGRFILVEQLHRPWSYVVPSELFPTRIEVWDAAGRVVKLVTDRPLADNLPIAFDAVATGPREVEWRADAPATLVWAEALDGGDPNKAAPAHDRLFALNAPFSAAPRALADLKERYRGVVWGRGDLAIVTTRWWRTRHETRLALDPQAGGARVLLERNYQDQYNDPGLPLTREGAFGRPVLALTKDGAGVLMAGEGASRDGEHPFLARMDLKTGAQTRLWTSQDPYYERVISLVDDAGATLLTRRESRSDAPNYFVRKVGVAKPRALTRFPDPEPQFAGVSKQLVSYKRADGVGLSGTLYLPAGYDAKRDGPLPTLLWAYPTEYTDAAVAGQVVDRARNRFVRPTGISPLFLVTQGYAVFDGPSMPIIGEKGAQPNDSYVEQLVANAKAAVDTVVGMGVADRDRMAVGGHSYGAFMTANLLAHSNLFRAGIARSGAYNRTLTPFGFQAEERTYWQATDTYTKMSPFTYAPQIKEPILLIHGEADDNSGTFPVQSERFYAALKGAGATVRYVTLPNEPHGYRGRESTLHTLWEMTDWLDRYVKHAPPSAGAATPAAR